MAAREKNWGQFVGDPEWKTLSTTPGFTDAGDRDEHHVVHPATDGVFADLIASRDALMPN